MNNSRSVLTDEHIKALQAGNVESNKNNLKITLEYLKKHPELITATEIDGYGVNYKTETISKKLPITPELINQAILVVGGHQYKNYEMATVNALLDQLTREAHAHIRSKKIEIQKREQEHLNASTLPTSPALPASPASPPPTLDDAIKAIHNYLAKSPGEKSQFMDLVKCFDRHIYTVRAEHMTGEIREIQEKILEIYAHTFTAVARAEYEKFNIDHLKRLKDFDSQTSNITGLSGDIAKSVMLQVVYEEDDHIRKGVIERYILLADKLTKEGNFFSANGIYQGLAMPECSRLYKNNSGINLTEIPVKKLIELQSLYGGRASDKNHLIELMTKCNGSTLPVLDKLKFDIETKYAGSMDKLTNEKNSLEKEWVNLKNKQAEEVTISAMELKIKEYAERIQEQSHKNLAKVGDDYKQIYKAEKAPLLMNNIDLSVDVVTQAKSVEQTLHYLTIGDLKSILETSRTVLENRLSFALKDGDKDSVVAVIEQYVKDITPVILVRQNETQELITHLNTVMNTIRDSSFDLKQLQNAEHQKDRIVFQQKVLTPVENTYVLFKQQNDKEIKAVNELSNRRVSHMQQVAREQMINKTPIYGKLLAYQEALQNRCEVHKDDKVSQNKLDVISRITTTLLEMKLNNMPADAMSQYLKNQIQDNHTVLEGHHKSLGGMINKLLNRESTAINLLRKHLNEWDALHIEQGKNIVNTSQMQQWIVEGIAEEVQLHPLATSAKSLQTLPVKMRIDDGHPDYRHHHETLFHEVKAGHHPLQVQKSKDDDSEGEHPPTHHDV